MGSPWEDVKPPPGKSRLPEPRLRIMNMKLGVLNLDARNFLFGGQRTGMVRFQRNPQTKQFSIVAVADHGLVVDARGRVTVTAITSFGGKPPVTLQLAPGDQTWGRRLVVAGVAE